MTFDPITDQPVVTGLWTNAIEMGKCAGMNMAGKKKAYGGTLGIMNATQVAGMPFVSMGRVHTKGSDLEVHRLQTSSGFRKMVFDGREPRLVGALLIGDIGKSGLYRSLIRERKDISKCKNHIINDRLHYGHLLLDG